ncbi:hypothetical protein VPH35_059054 [Triticum aestivum]
MLVSCPAAGLCSSRARQQDRARFVPGAPDGSMEASFGRPIGFRRWGQLRGAKGGPFRPYLWLGLRWVSSEVVSRSGMPGWRPLVVVPRCSWAEPVVRCCPVAMVVWATWSLGCGVRWW